VSPLRAVQHRCARLDARLCLTHARGVFSGHALGRGSVSCIARARARLRAPRRCALAVTPLHAAQGAQPEPALCARAEVVAAEGPRVRERVRALRPHGRARVPRAARVPPPPQLARPHVLHRRPNVQGTRFPAAEPATCVTCAVPFVLNYAACRLYSPAACSGGTLLFSARSSALHKPASHCPVPASGEKRRLPRDVVRRGHVRARAARVPQGYPQPALAQAGRRRERRLRGPVQRRREGALLDVHAVQQEQRAAARGAQIRTNFRCLTLLQ
jgi:hypothetical protein